MGGKISKRKIFRRNNNERSNYRRNLAVVQAIVDEDHQDTLSVKSEEHIYMNMDELNEDIDHVDGTYYQPIDQDPYSMNVPPRHRNSIDTTTSRDSAFSEKSDNSKQSRHSYASAKNIRREPQNYEYAYQTHTEIKRQHSKPPFKRNSKKRSPRRNGAAGYVTNDVTDARAFRHADNIYFRQASQRSDSSGNFDGYSALPRFRSKSKQKHQAAICSSSVDDYARDWIDVCKEPMKRVEFLVEAFQPLIARCLNVMDLVPHLFFIEDSETFREKHRQNPRHAVDHLIRTIKHCDEPGKWQAFLEALKSEGYEYIANLLLEETEADHETNRNVLRLFTPELITRMDPEEFIDHLLEEDAIRETDREEIQCEKRNRGNTAASLLLLERVPRRLENWPDVFINVLEKCGLGDLTENFRIPEFSTETIGCFPYAREDMDDYLTPYEDDETSPKSFERRASVKKLIEERDNLMETVKREREKRNLRTEIQRLQEEFEALANLNQNRTTADQQTSEYVRCEPERHDDASKYLSTTKADTAVLGVSGDTLRLDDTLRSGGMLSSGETLRLADPSRSGNTPRMSDTAEGNQTKDQIPKENVDTNTDHQTTPDTNNMILSKIATGVEGIHGLLKEIRDGAKANPNKSNTFSTQFNSTQHSIYGINVQQNISNGNGFIMLPSPHALNKNLNNNQGSYLPLNGSLDSAISVGYITANAEQYV